MSQVLITRYLAELDRLKKVGGTHRESVVREAFKDLLKGWGVIDLLGRVTRVSVETMRIVGEIEGATR